MRSLLATLIVLVPLAAVADAPSAWAVCASKQAGDSCAGMYFPGGVCTAVDSGNCGPDMSPCLFCESHGSTTGGGGNCDVGAGRAAGGAALFGFLGLLLLARTRRKT